MSIQNSPSPQLGDNIKIVCRLRWSPRPICEDAGEIELENITDYQIDIVNESCELDHLDLIVKNENKEVVSGFQYGGIFSPYADGYIWHFKPKEIYTGTVRFFATVPPPLRLAGKYSVQAAYKYDSICSVSEEIEFIVSKSQEPHTE